MSDPVMATKYFPLFYTCNTITLGQLIKILEGDYWLVKRTEFPLPEFLVRRANNKLLKGAERVLRVGSFSDYNYSKSIRRSIVNPYDYTTDWTTLNDIVLAVELVIDQTIDRNINLQEFRTFFEKALRNVRELEKSEKN